MSAVRTIFKWIFRFSLVVILLLGFAWAGIRISRAYHLRAALQPPSAFMVENAPVIALIHARVIDGTASPAQDDQTLILENGMINDVGPSSSIKVPAGARVIDLSGKTVFPGLVMLHEHLFTISPDSTPKKILVVEQPVSFPLMYLAAGVTTLRTTGSMISASRPRDKERHRLRPAPRAGHVFDCAIPGIEPAHFFADACDRRSGRSTSRG